MRDERWNVLIVDDDENDRFLLTQSLSKAKPGIRISQVRGGEEAIRYLNGEGEFRDRTRYPFPTWVFVDLKMPQVDGFTVLSHLKGNPCWAVIPTLVFTASADEDDVKKAFLCGATAYHVKPVDTSERDLLCRKLIDYWATSEVPRVDEHGAQLQTESSGKLGERIPQP
jgi:CheY-like chemotaxis protein